MAQYIDKNALVAEIKRLRDRAYELYGCSQFDTAYNNVLKSIATLEYKEVDLDFQHFVKELAEVYALPASIVENTKENPLNWEYAIAKHFYELGMAVDNKAQKGEKV